MADFIVLMILAGVVLLAVRRIIKMKKSGGCASCAGCSKKSSCLSAQNKEKL